MLLNRDELGEEAGGITKIFNQFFAFVLNKVTHLEQFVDLTLISESLLQECPLAGSQVDLLRF